MTWNARSLSFVEMASVRYIMSDMKVDVMGVSEIWGYGAVGVFETLDGGLRVRGVGNVNRKRGVALIVKEDTQVAWLDEFTFRSDCFEAVAGLIGDVVVAQVYIANGSKRDGIEMLNTYLELLDAKFTRVIVMGDMNARMGVLEGERRNAAGIELERILQCSRFSREEINTVTCKPGQSCLDHILSTCPERHVMASCFPFYMGSDHRPVWVEIQGDVRRGYKPQDAGKSKLYSVAWKKVAQYVETRVHEIEIEMKQDGLEEAVRKFITLHAEGVAKYQRARTYFENLRLEIDEETRQLFVRKRTADGEERRMLTKQIKTRIRRLKRKAWMEFCTRGQQDSSGRMLWSMFRRSRGRPQGQFQMADKQKVLDLAEEFEQNFVIREDLVPETKWEEVDEVVESLPNDMQGVTSEDVEEILRALPRKGSVGDDQISYLMLKEAGTKTVDFITEVVNWSLSRSELMSSWRLALVRPLPKGDGRFRPISLLSNLAKVVERVVVWKLKDYAVERSLIPSYQFAAGGGTEVALEKLIEYVLDGGTNVTYAVFLDIRKAFDRVHNQTLIMMLTRLGIPGYLVRWIRKFLKDRTCVLGNVRFPMANGVPQGSVLGPILFQLYVAEMLEIRNLEVYRAAYADDFVIALRQSSSESPQNVVGEIGVQLQLNKALRQIERVCLKLGVELDPNKTKAMWLCKTSRRIKPKLIPLRLGGHNLQYTPWYKYLGVVLDNRLTMRQHVKTKVETIGRRNKFVFRLSGLSKRPVRSLWRGYVESYLRYGLKVTYDLMSKTNRLKLKQAYDKSVRKIAGCIASCPAHLAYREAGMNSFDGFVRRIQDYPETDEEQVLRKGSVEFPPARSVVHAEVNFARWRTGYLYLNTLKHKMTQSHTPLCRKCGRKEETREHILFECDALVQGSREKFFSVLPRGATLSCHTVPSLDQLLGLEEQLTETQLRALARALAEFCDVNRIFA